MIFRVSCYGRSSRAAPFLILGRRRSLLFLAPLFLIWWPISSCVSYTRIPIFWGNLSLYFSTRYFLNAGPHCTCRTWHLGRGINEHTLSSQYTFLLSIQHQSPAHGGGRPHFFILQRYKLCGPTITISENTKQNRISLHRAETREQCRR